MTDLTAQELPPLLSEKDAVTLCESLAFQGQRTATVVRGSVGWLWLRLEDGQEVRFPTARAMGMHIGISEVKPGGLWVPEDGKTIYLKMDADGAAIWEDGEDHLRFLLRKRHWTEGVDWHEETLADGIEFRVTLVPAGWYWMDWMAFPGKDPWGSGMGEIKSPTLQEAVVKARRYMMSLIEQFREDTKRQLAACDEAEAKLKEFGA